MNLRDLTIFIADQMEDRLTECGIDVNQITQIKILSRKLPPDDNVVWMLRPLDHKFDFETVCDMLQRWIKPNWKSGMTKSIRCVCLLLCALSIRHASRSLMN